MSGRSKRVKRARRQPAAKPAYISQDDLSLFCEEITEKLQQLEGCIEDLTGENEQLQEEIVRLKGELLLLQQRIERLSTWHLAGPQALSRFMTVRADEMPVVVLRWDGDEGDEQA